MELQFHGFIKNVVGEEKLIINLTQKIRLLEVFNYLPSELVNWLPYGTSTTDAQFLAIFSFFEGGRLLKLNDEIDPKDTILIMLPATGG
jgi:hypothetical protein